jgi:hypothetical protein
MSCKLLGQSILEKKMGRLDYRVSAVASIAVFCQLPRQVAIQSCAHFTLFVSLSTSNYGSRQ